MPPLPHNYNDLSCGQLLKAALFAGLGKETGEFGEVQPWTRKEFAENIDIAVYKRTRRRSYAVELTESSNAVEKWIDEDVVPSCRAGSPPYSVAVFEVLFGQNNDDSEAWKRAFNNAWAKKRQNRKLNITKQDRATYFKPAEKEVTPNFSKKSAKLEKAKEDSGVDHMSKLMDRLQENYKEELEGFFYKTTNGNSLPFWEIPTEQFGLPNFPLPIVDTEHYPADDRGEDSFCEQREILGSRLYPGNIYRLLNAAPNEWQLARTVYTDLIDSCDYLRARIFAGWAEVYTSRDDTAQNNFIKNSPLIVEWLERIRQIKTGNFSTYLAGMAFTIPIFKIEKDQSITLFMGKSSKKKASGGGMFHCCPAGMLEFGGDYDANELSFNDWRTYVLKELIEETLKDDETKSTAIIDTLDNDSKDLFSLTSLRPILKQVIENWDGDKKAVVAANKFKNIQFGEAPCFVIVDAFRLRPEIIMPLFIDEDLRILPNWEYKGRVNEIRNFQSFEDAEGSLVGQLTQWAEPGLAAALLSSKYWFEK